MANPSADHGTPGNPGQYTVSSQLKTVIAILIFLGIAGLVVGLMREPQRAWTAYLVAFFYFTTLALGGVFFVAVNHVAKSGWNVNVRRLNEAYSAFLPISAIAAAIFLIGAPRLYDWLDAAKVAADELLKHKESYLNGGFFVARLVLFFLVWIWLARNMVKGSLEQDKSGDENITHKQVKRGVIFLLFFALSYSLFAVDLIMSVQPHWFSTIFGIYCFAGLFQSTMAFTILMVLYLKKNNCLHGFVTEDHLHDLGKFMFAFTVFWAYIAFSQYMLIWYANLPEETIFIKPRTEGAWLPVSIFLLIGKFVVPFVALLPRWAKRTPAHLVVVSVWMLAMEYLDIYWLVYPAYFKDSPTSGSMRFAFLRGS